MIADPLLSALQALSSLQGLAAESDAQQARRLFHGRGGRYEGLAWVTLDALWPTLFFTFFKKPPDDFEFWIKDHLVPWCEQQPLGFVRVLAQHRYEKPCRTESVWGSFVTAQTVLRGNQQYAIRFDRQNIGFFLDMEPARRWLEAHAKHQRVLNLFSYTCVFSVVAMAAGASSVVNVDMSKGALTTGRTNHHQNNVSTDQVHFMPYNLLKSWSRVAKQGPYDLAIIDPPSFQKGSFQASRDYVKVVRRVMSMLSPGGLVMACLNAPELGSDFLQSIFSEFAPQAQLLEQLPVDPVFESKASDSTLKVLIFQV